MEEPPFICPRHNVAVYRISLYEAKRRGVPFGCATCTEELAARPLASDMTPFDRALELRFLLDQPSTVSFNLIHKRVEDLMGRGVMTHEFALPKELEAEILGETEAPAPGALEKLERLAPGKPVIIVRAT